MPIDTSHIPNDHLQYTYMVSLAIIWALMSCLFVWIQDEKGYNMKYISTRGLAPALAFEEAMLTGLALDGGLYVQSIFPK